MVQECIILPHIIKLFVIVKHFPEIIKISLSTATPFGQIPQLEVDGVKYCQSLSIARYLAKKTGKSENPGIPSH